MAGRSLVSLMFGALAAAVGTYIYFTNQVITTSTPWTTYKNSLSRGVLMFYLISAFLTILCISLLQLMNGWVIRHFDFCDLQYLPTELVLNSVDKLFIAIIIWIYFKNKHLFAINRLTIY